MICPDCQKSFPISFTYYVHDGQEVHQCPHCRFLGKLHFTSKKNEITHAVLLLLLIFFIPWSFKVALHYFFSTDAVDGITFGILLMVLVLYPFDKFLQEKYKILIMEPRPSPKKRIIRSIPNPIVYSIFYLLFLFSVMIVTTIILGIHDSSKHQEIISAFNKKQNHNLEVYKNKMLDDFRLLDKSPLFVDLTRDKDAGIILDQKITWDRPDTYIKSRTPISNIFRKYDKWWKDHDQLLKLKASNELKQLDLAWIIQLNDFDYWKIENHPDYNNDLKKVSKLSADQKGDLFQNFPTPDYSELRQFAIAHFIQQYNKGNAIEGLKTLRHIAKLNYSVGTVLGNMFASRLLLDEHSLVKSFGIKNWKLIPKVKLKAFRRIAYSGRQLFMASWFQDFPKDFLVFLNPQTGMCASGLEMITSLIKFRDYLEPQFFFEHDFSLIYQNHIRFYENLLNNCNMKDYQVFLLPTQSGADPWIKEIKQEWWQTENNSVSEIERTLNDTKIPYSRKEFSLYLLTELSGDYLKPYKKNKILQSN